MLKEFPQNITPAMNYAKNTESVVNQANFGDGYIQSVPQGINHNITTYELSFNRIPSEIDTIEDFLINQVGKGNTFFWYEPKTNEKIKVKQSSELKIGNGYNFSSLSVTFRRVYEL